uniref:OCIA domain-containing protein 1-like isoform X2 n=1 Tax=Myxine glutinosa TaxID=7769 RepID=UPI00358F1C2B
MAFGGSDQESIQPYILSEEERRVIQECGREAMLYRGLPAAMVCAGITNGLVQYGILRTSKRFGRIPHIFFAGITGFLFGRLLYISKCREKIMRLENSPLAEAFKMGKTPSQIMMMQEQRGAVPDSLEEESSPYTPVDAFVQLDHDGYQPSGLAEDTPFSLESADEPESGNEPQKHTTYDELRSKNRERFEVVLGQPVTNRHPDTRTSFPVDPCDRKPVKKNKYGDLLEE